MRVSQFRYGSLFSPVIVGSDFLAAIAKAKLAPLRERLKEKYSDANPDDFRLEALIAHECGHQRLLRVENLREVLAKFPEEFEPEAWLAKEIEAAKKDPKRDVRTLEMLCSALESEMKKERTSKTLRRPAKALRANSIRWGWN